MDTRVIATSFVDFVLERDNWKEVEEMSENGIRIIFDVFTAAGFKPKQIVFGKLRGKYMRQGNEETGETYPINQSCPMKVIGQDGNDDFRATGWLDCLFRVANNKWPFTPLTPLNMTCDKVADAVEAEIKRSVPLEPIRLTVEWDILEEYPPKISDHTYFVNHTKDDKELKDCVGIHTYCGGWVDRRQATKDQDCLLCRECHLRVLFPEEIKTYGELREFLRRKLLLPTSPKLGMDTPMDI